ncbi:GatB/YqeY domain-containing protein [Alkalimarinus alittae]|uniref:GatB/YqeY domain-containing protein n=1 Tax=Alkalimarinus alittae TaxID=2961619 RepID=A0ABY6N1B0_9ALTE|nr:GatB/YqeY domain-containing protein [Alkalimarinus alittae]UZE95885.1 GatB/YqeY domain-containing protein [Alkalimarinus alittae]
MASTELKSNVKDAMKDAMRAKDKPRLGTIRLIMAEIKRIEVDERTEIDDERLLTILDKMVKQRRDSARQYSDAGRTELAQVELDEIVIIQEFLPEPLSNEELDILVQQAVSESGATTVQEMGKVMAILKPKVQGRADMGNISGKVKKAFL